MLKRVLCLFSFIAVCLTTQFSQSQVAGQSTKNNLTPPKTPDVHAQSPTKEDLDVRDYGVDCGFKNDSSVALNAITARPPLADWPLPSHGAVMSSWPRHG